MSATASTCSTDDQMEAFWLAFWRFLASKGINPFPAVQLCPCGIAMDRCECVADDPGRIAHETEVAIT